MSNDLRNYLVRLLNGKSLSRLEATDLVDRLLDNDSSDAKIAATLAAMTAKGETVEELAGMASALRARAINIKSCHRRFIDTAGTGSSPAKVFNISTAAAFVIAGAGLPVAKHGNRAASSTSGSADVLSAMGVNISATPEVSQHCLNEIGICFMFAPIYHGATARVAAVRRELGIQTSFNLLGPLSNPARAPRQIIGVCRPRLVELLAHVLALLGTERAWVVHGEDGLDEITLAGKTFVAEALEGRVSTFEITPTDFGYSESSLTHLRGGDAESNAGIIRDVLAGTRRDEARALVVANAAAALVVGSQAGDLREAVVLAETSIDSGAAQMKLQQLISITNN
ncbi:MAG TPA: anthranilate phosphoribosyltransferase [Pyrinomonadaceae bacterium]|nr:anthranilate phosphoribosyltransferase [Pyrinomonadaceae bacterium]